ncbi:MAG TPA: DNA repair protein RecN [Atribacterota bacterium]|nr:DNA repair protein RecN [Atribacterota bacterium]
MLNYLHIKNFALIDELSVEFEKGLNVITGETGAGKSMIIEAINVILGSPISQNWSKNDKECLEIEALFYLDAISRKQLQELQDINPTTFLDNQLIIRREIHQSRRSKCFINNQLVTLSVLQEIGNYLIDLHGQHSHQSLLNPLFHIDFVDSFENGLFSEKKEKFYNHYKQWQTKKKILEEIKEKHSETLSKKDYLLYQLKEIEQAKLKNGEDQELEEIVNIIRHKAKIKEVTEKAYDVLFDGNSIEEIPILDLLARLISSFDNISNLDHKINNIKEQLSEVQLKIEDISSQILEYKEKIDLDVYQLQEIEERLNLINHLKHKYGSKIEDILKYNDNLQKELSSIEDDEIKMEKLKKEIEVEEKILIELSLELSSQRKSIARKLEQDIILELAELNMKNCNFVIKIEQQEDKNGLPIADKMFKVTQDGIDRVEFFISTNVGEKIKPLTDIVSGGEVSRIMLGLKSILSKADQIPIMIFDEIDSGVGARLGAIIARKLAKIAQNHQVIAVTHLPQIACQANQHLYISKYVSLNKTILSIKKLAGDEQLYEIARMLDGDKYGSISIEHAEKMLHQKGDE